MQIRFPWLKSRRHLLVAILLDGALFLLLYADAYQRRFGGLPTFTLPLTWLLEFWLISSYVMGRYYDVAEPRPPGWLSQLVRTLITLVLSIGVFLAWLWITASPGEAVTSRQFLLPMLLIFASVSGLVQVLINRVQAGRFGTSTTWLVMGSPGFQALLQQQLAWSRLNVELRPWDGSQPATSSAAGLVLDDLMMLPKHEIAELLLLQEQGLKVVTPVGWSELVLQRFPPALVREDDLLRGQFTEPRGSVHRRLKRLGDVLMSVLLLVFTAPLMLLAALLIWLDDRGPVFYGQQRSGLNGRLFQIWKLRSMRVDAEAQGAQWAGRNDSRITRIGSVLRLTRIDELPQLWAVLHGEMSLIGPRPERPELEAELEQSIPHYRLRHLIRPGLSGWAQVNYPYGASIEDAANKLSYDLYYLRNFSFWLDLLILLKTIRLVFNARGALPSNGP